MIFYKLNDSLAFNNKELTDITGLDKILKNEIKNNDKE